MIQRVVVALLMLSLPPVVAAQGLYWESTTASSTNDGMPVKNEYYYMPKKFKATVPDRNEAMIFRLDKELMIMVDHEKKEYTEMTFVEMERMVRQGMDQLAELRKQMQSMPEEQRKMMEQMLGTKVPREDAAISVKKAGDRKSISGYACTKYIISQEGAEDVVIWTTSGVKDFEAMKTDMEVFSKRMAELTPVIGKGMAEGMAKIDGFPMQTEAAGIVSTVTKVEKRSTPASAFEPPAGYKKVKQQSPED